MVFHQSHFLLFPTPTDQRCPGPHWSFQDRPPPLTACFSPHSRLLSEPLTQHQATRSITAKTVPSDSGDECPYSGVGPQAASGCTPARGARSGLRQGVPQTVSGKGCPKRSTRALCSSNPTTTLNLRASSHTIPTRPGFPDCYMASNTASTLGTWSHVNPWTLLSAFTHPCPHCTATEEGGRIRGPYHDRSLPSLRCSGG